MKIKNAKIIIFGGTGFIGKSLTNFLNLNTQEFLSFGSKDIDLVNSKEVNIKLSKIVFNNRTIIFLSALRPGSGDVLDTAIKNLIMLKNVVTNVNLNQIKHFIYVSSDAVFTNEENITENTPKTSNSLYGLMHIMREIYLLNNLQKEKLTILRPCAVYGINETSFNYGINRFVNEAINNKIINLIGHGEEKRDHIYVEDLVSLIFLCFKKTIIGEFNIATGNSKSFKEISSIIARTINNEIKIIKNPRLQPIIHKSFDTKKLKTTFFDIEISSIEKGIEKFLEHHKF